MEGQYQNAYSKDSTGGMNWINMALDRSKCWALVNMVMNLWVPYTAG
jgi:hypothetical protein